MGSCGGWFPILHRPSPNLGRVGIYNCPFGAFSRFTRVTACQVAAVLSTYICPRSFSRKVSLSRCPGSYRDEPSISRTGLAPVGDLRLRGAPRCCGYHIFDENRDYSPTNCRSGPIEDSHISTIRNRVRTRYRYQHHILVLARLQMCWRYLD